MSNTPAGEKDRETMRKFLLPAHAGSKPLVVRHGRTSYRLREVVVHLPAATSESFDHPTIAFIFSDTKNKAPEEYDQVRVLIECQRDDGRDRISREETLMSRGFLGSTAPRTRSYAAKFEESFPMDSVSGHLKDRRLALATALLKRRAAVWEGIRDAGCRVTRKTRNAWEDHLLSWICVAQRCKAAVQVVNRGLPDKRPRTAPRLWVYGCRNRPPMFASVPAGWTAAGQHAAFAHGLISYPERLSDEDRERYELTLIPTAAEVEALVRCIAEQAASKGWHQGFHPSDFWSVVGAKIEDEGCYADRADVASRVHVLLPAAPAEVSR